MISHKHKCIFIHIPKTAGTSINTFFVDKNTLDWQKPDYNILYGWCPKRHIHLQHATSKQLIETELISEEQWKTYFKFTFVRNPWDRAYSDYFWIMKDRNVSGSFNDYLLKERGFKNILSDHSTMSYRGDHIIPQTDFFDFHGLYKPDFIGKFENFSIDIKIVLERLGLNEEFKLHENKQTKPSKHYSEFYTKSNKKLIDSIYSKDIELLNYTFEDKKSILSKLKDFVGVNNYF